MRKRNVIKLLAITALFIMSMSTGVFASEGFDMSGALDTTVGELTTQFWAIISVAIPAVLVIVGGRMVVMKGISWFKAITAKA